MEEIGGAGLYIYGWLKSGVFWAGFSYACFFMYGIAYINKKFGKLCRKNFCEKTSHLFTLFVIMFMVGLIGILFPFILFIKGDIEE